MVGIGLFRRRKAALLLVAGVVLVVLIVNKQPATTSIAEQDALGYMAKLSELTKQAMPEKQTNATNTASHTLPAVEEHSEDDEAWLKLQQERKNRVREVCESERIDAQYVGNPPKSLMVQLKVDDRHKVIYCYVPKAACTSWKSIFVRLSGAADVDPDHPERFRHSVHDDSFLARHGIKALDSFPQNGITGRLANYTKFIVVRHPFLRLHSAFQDKFRVFDDVGLRFQKHWGKDMIRLYRTDPSVKSLKTGQNATFEEFLRYLGDEAVPYRQKMEPHWKSVQRLCHPCVFNYDYITTTESLEEDSANILDRVFHSSYRLQNLHTIGHTRSTAFDSIPTDIVDKLFPYYGVDFRMFGYKWPLDA